MNIAFYGHTNTLVFTYTKNGKFHKQALLGGIRQIYHSARTSMETNNVSLHIGSTDVSPDSNEYRRDYYGLRQYNNVFKKEYYGISKYLGYEEGTAEGNIFSVMPDNPDAPIDILFVWDEGYGGLSIPDCKNVLWASDKALPDKQQFEKIASNCFLFLDGNVLRKAGAMLSRQISWERTASELISEIQNNPAVSYLLNARQLLISFGVDGAVFILPKNKDGKLEASLILTHGEVEGEIAKRQPSQVADVIVFLNMATTFTMGVTSQAATAFDTMPKGETNDFFTKFLNSLINLIKHSESGSSEHFENTKNDALKWGGVLRTILETGETIASAAIIEIEDMADENKDSQNVKVKLRNWAAFPIPFVTEDFMFKVPEDWTVISSVEDRQIYDVAFDYVQNGTIAIEGLPRFSLGSFTTVDRWEIESFQNIGNLIMQYANTESIRPLSITVFGAPGSGKSFGVTQIAKNILPGKVEKLEFNVSQFLSVSDLSVAFQKVRDVVLEGKLPLVFFDEFDSDKDGINLGWIKSFLMPMQDGRFRDESGEHPLGKCILVFAGGTKPDFEKFTAPMTLKDNDFKNKKGPDFISRLRGTINVYGPNPKYNDDKNYILRRALLLRGLCERDKRLAMKDGKAPISPAIIRAMLKVPEYKHGARSMEAILDMSRIEDGIFEPAALPFHSQLALHVDADAFLRLVRRG